jgi:mono/diheme cytochrome c family protein
VRRAVLIVLSCGALAGFLAGCGAEGVATPTPNTVIGKGPAAPTFPIVPAFKLKGDPTAGGGIFKSSGCVSCHTLAAAHSTGTVGPNLDQLKPDYRAVTAQVTNGGGAMPAFKATLSAQQVADVAAYVVNSTGGTAP